MQQTETVLKWRMRKFIISLATLVNIQQQLSTHNMSTATSISRKYLEITALRSPHKIWIKMKICNFQLSMKKMFCRDENSFIRDDINSIVVKHHQHYKHPFSDYECEIQSDEINNVLLLFSQFRKLLSLPLSIRFLAGVDDKQEYEWNLIQFHSHFSFTPFLTDPERFVRVQLRVSGWCNNIQGFSFLYLSLQLATWVSFLHSNRKLRLNLHNVICFQFAIVRASFSSAFRFFFVT